MISYCFVFRSCGLVCNQRAWLVPVIRSSRGYLVILNLHSVPVRKNREEMFGALVFYRYIACRAAGRSSHIVKNVFLVFLVLLVLLIDPHFFSVSLLTA